MGGLSNGNQALTFLMSLPLGAALCLLYDVLRIMRIFSGRGRTCSRPQEECSKNNGVKRGRKESDTAATVIIAVEDVLYSVLALFIVCSYFLLYCNGEVRGYVLVGSAVGFLLFRLTLSRLFVRAGTALLKLSSVVLGFLLKPARFVMDALDKAVGLAQRNIKKIFKRPKKHLERNKQVSV